jgi:uncharacterized membrane protein YbhN (UPF0104 family)
METSITASQVVRRAVPGFAGWTVALGVFLLLFGTESVVSAARTLATPSAGPLVALGVVATVCWGVSLWRTLSGVGAAVHPVRAVGLFFAATFINGVTPFGQTGGDPVSAVLVERTTGVDYESGLAAIVSVTGVNRLVSVGVAGVAGMLTLRAGTTPESLAVGGPVTLVAAGALLAVVGVVGIVGAGGPSAGTEGRRRATSSVRAAASTAHRRLPRRVRRRLAALRSRGVRFTRAMRRTLGDRRTTATVVCFGVLGEVALGATLWGTLVLLGAPASPALALAVVPLSRVGAVAPTPGGAGGVEVALAGLLVALGSVAAPVAGVAALAFRLLTFAVPTVVGGGVVALAVTRD